MPRRHRLLAVALACFTPFHVVASLAHAAPVEDRDTEKARRHFKKGEELYQAQRYDEALVEFQAAREAKPLPALLYNIARCHEALGQTPDAIKAYQEYLSTAPDAEDVAPVVRHIEELQGHVSHSTEDLDTALARRHADRGMRLYEEGRYELALSAFEDARQAKPLPAFYYDIARCLEHLRRWPEARTSYEEYLEAGAEPRDVALVKQKLVLLDEMISREQRIATEPERKTHRRVATWVLLGSTVAVGAGAGVAGAVAYSRQQAGSCLLCKPQDVTTPRDVAIGLGIGAGVVLVATIIAAIVESR